MIDYEKYSNSLTVFLSTQDPTPPCNSNPRLQQQKMQTNHFRSECQFKKFDAKEAIQYHRPSELVAHMNNGKFCPKCICFACNKVISECLEWQSHCHASTTNMKWRETRKSLTGDIYIPPNAAGPVVKEVAVKPVKAKKEKKVKVVVPLTEALSWFGDVYPAETFKHLMGNPLGKAIYKYFLAAVKPLKTAQESVTTGEIMVEIGEPGTASISIFVTISSNIYAFYSFFVQIYLNGMGIMLG
jgi:hypothetical protein